MCVVVKFITDLLKVFSMRTDCGVGTGDRCDLPLMLLSACVFIVGFVAMEDWRAVTLSLSS
jgi:hypothetical protein